MLDILKLNYPSLWGPITFEIEALLLVLPTTEYQKRVHVAIGTTITDMAVDFIHENNPENVSKSWKAVCCATQSRRLVQAQPSKKGIHQDYQASHSACPSPPQSLKAAPS